MNPIRLTILGSGDLLGSGGRFQTCFALDAENTHYLIDCGASSLIAMKRFGVDPASIDGLLVSHLHGDHFGGLPFLILEAQFGRRTRDLTVCGPAGIVERTNAAMEVLFPGSTKVERKFRTSFVEFADRQALHVGPLEVTPFEVVHASGATPYALRIAMGGKVIAYSGDTQWTESLGAVAQDADVFVCEAYTFDKAIRYHLDFATLATHRSELTCKRLILTHMSENMMTNLPQVDVEAASDGMVITL